MEREAYDDFCVSVGKLIGNECRGVFTGDGCDFHLRLEFGADWSKRTLPSFNVSAFEAEFALFIGEAGWRIENAESVLCSFTDDDGISGLASAIMNQLKGRKVLDVQTFFPSYDVFLLFDGGIWFKIFNIWAHEVIATDNYAFVEQNFVYTIENRSTLQKRTIGVD